MRHTTQPTPSEFGLSADDLSELKRIELTADKNEGGVSWMENFFPKKEGWLVELIGGLLFWTVLWPFFLIGLLFTPVVQGIARMRLRAHPKYKSFKAFEHAVFQHERSKRDFWLRLTGTSFEHQLAVLYRHLGYSATVTPGSGDKGVDIVLTGNGKRIIVQCKQHSTPVGPAVARELYGSMIASGADSAILACTSGFTTGVFDFVREKPIELVDVEAIVRMQEKVNVEQGHSQRRG